MSTQLYLGYEDSMLVVLDVSQLELNSMDVLM